MEFPFSTSPEQVGGGTLVSYVSLESGSGASTLACMHALYSAESTETALLDLDPASKVRAYTGLPVDVSSASVIDLNGVTEAKSIYSAGEEIGSNLYVYPGITRLMDAPQIDANLCLKSATFLKQSFKKSIAVAGPIYGPCWIALLQSDLICVVVTPDRINIDVFKDGMDYLSRLGCGERTKIILNQLGIPGGIRDDDIQKSFSHDYVISYDRAIRQGCNRRKLQLTKPLIQMFDALGKEGI